jgi:hypothetical protein
MIATFSFSESNTNLETITDSISNLNFGSLDAPNLNTLAYPVTAAQSSFEKYIRAKFTGVGAGTISNMLFWKLLGAYVTGETITCAYNQAFVTPSSVANADSAVPTTSAGSSAVQSSAGASTITSDGYTKYIRLQTQTSALTVNGAGNQKTFTFQYDEV